MIFLLKSHVHGFQRHYMSGSIGTVRDYNRETPVMFKPVGGKSFKSGTVVDIGKDHYTIQGKRDNAGNVETHTVPKVLVASLPEWEGLKAKVSIDKTAESKQRAEAGMKRTGMSESEILRHPKINATIAGSTYKLARSNGLDTAMIKDGDVIQVQDADYQDMIHEYIMGATNALRRETANAPDGDIEEFKNYLNGKVETSRIAAQMATEGKGSAIRFLNKRKEEKESLVDTSSLDDPEGRGTGKMSQLFSTQADHDEHVAGPLHVGVDRVLSNLPDVHAEIIRRKFGLNEYKPQSNEDIAEALNDKGLKYQDKYKWDRNYVGQAFQEAVLKLRDVAGVEELKDFLKSVKERLTMLKSRKNIIGLPYLIKSYSSDLAKEHPGGHWVTVRQGPLEGRHLYIVSGDGGARVVAGGGPAMKGRVLGGKGSMGGKEKTETQALKEDALKHKNADDFIGAQKAHALEKYRTVSPGQPEVWYKRQVESMFSDKHKQHFIDLYNKAHGEKGNSKASHEMTKEEFHAVTNASILPLIQKYVHETGHKVDTNEDIERVKQKYPKEWADIEAKEAHKKKIYDSLPEEVKNHFKVNEMDASTHKNLVGQAIKDGKHVPEHVLKDYPELAKKKEPEAGKLDPKIEQMIARHAEEGANRIEERRRKSGGESMKKYGHPNGYRPETKEEHGFSVEARKGGLRELYSDIQNKNMHALDSKLNLMNTQSIKFYNEVTGQKVKTLKEIHESLRKLDPEKYDAMMESNAKRSEQIKKDAAQREMLSQLEDRVNHNGKTLTKKEFVDSLIDNGHVHYAEQHNGVQSRAYLSKDGKTGYKFTRKAERDYIKQKLADKAKQASPTEPVTVEHKNQGKGYKIPKPESNEVPVGLNHWVETYKTQRAAGNVKGAKETKANIDKEIKRMGLDSDKVYGVEKPSAEADIVQTQQSEKGTVHLTISNGKGGYSKKPVEADIHGHLAVHKTHEGEGYQITHAPTGLHLKDSISTKESATELAHKLNNAGVDWNFSDPDSTTSEMYGKVRDVLSQHKENAKAGEEAKPEMGKIEKIAEKDGYFKLTPSQHNSIMAVRHEINEGTPGRRIPIKDDDGYIAGWTAEPSTYPDYFQGKGYTKSDALTAIDKVLNGKKLTKKQQILVEDLNHSYRQRYASRIAKERATKEATAFHLKQGDTLKRHGTKYVVKKVDNSGFFPVATLQNGAVLKIEGDETIGYDRGTLKDAKGLQKAMMGFPYLLKKRLSVEAGC